MRRGYLTTEFWSMAAFFALVFIVKDWTVLSICGAVVVAYTLSRTKSKETPGVRNFTIHK